jgi:hypothetical protein
MKKQNLVVTFYVLYFIWLLIAVYLSPEATYLNYYTVAIVLFYFVFIRKPGDIFWFIIGAGGFILTKLFFITNNQINYDLAVIVETPIWLPMAWGTTIVALKRFYSILRKEDT